MIGNLPGVESLTFKAEIGHGASPIDIQFSGSDFTVLSDISEKMKEYLHQFPEIFDIQDSYSDGKEELQVELKPEAHALGFTRSDVLNQVRNGFLDIRYNAYNGDAMIFG